MNNEFVTLVDENDRACGVAEKFEAHRIGLLHRAVSVFLFDEQGRMLLQRRASSKYHSAGLWANTCCGHPRPDEQPLAAATRRLQEELGVTAQLEAIGQLSYEAEVTNNLVEREYVHLFMGSFRGTYMLNPEEVWEVALLDPNLISKTDMLPKDLLAPWFKIYLEKFWPVEF